MPSMIAWDEDKHFLKPFREKDFDQIHKNIITFAEYFKKNFHIPWDAYTLKNINCFVRNLFFCFERDEFTIPHDQINHYFHFYRILANLIRVSDYKNSDRVLKKLIKNQAKNIIKILILYSPFNSLTLDRKTLLDRDPLKGSRWFTNFISTFQTALADPEGYKQLRAHLSDTSLEITAIEDIKPAMFAPTYIDHYKDGAWKAKFNKIIRECRSLPDSNLENKHSQKIAIISGYWHKSHSIYRNQYHFLKALSEKYPLSFFFVSPPGRHHFDGELFKETHYLMKDNGDLDTSELEAGNFHLIYYTDIGLDEESSILSNARFAPIQVTSYGHSVSTFGSQIDYWIGGLKG